MGRRKYLGTSNVLHDQWRSYFPINVKGLNKIHEFTTSYKCYDAGAELHVVRAMYQAVVRRGKCRN